tara:strand:- start:9620 stop:9916 length:297 start_codon:yes stop_codon:yes gene_type:complete
MGWRASLNFNGWQPTTALWNELKQTLTARKDGQPTINDMKDKQFAKETLQEITQNIIDERGAFNLASVRKWLPAYSWFADVDKALSLDEQNAIILKTL